MDVSRFPSAGKRKKGKSAAEAARLEKEKQVSY
jgi:hypothetical protein